jgi:hypothetical protein
MSGQPFDVHSFCTQHPQAAQTVSGAQIGAVVGNAAGKSNPGTTDQEFERSFRKGMQVLCKTFPFLLDAEEKITLAPCFVNHVNFRFTEECKDSGSGDIYPRIFLPTLRLANKEKFYTMQDDKFKAFGRYPYDLMFDIWDDNWEYTWTQHGNQMSPRKLIPLLRWLEKQRYSMLSSIINTSKRDEMKKWAVDLKDSYKVARQYRGEEQAKSAYRDEAGDGEVADFSEPEDNTAASSEDDNDGTPDEDNDWKFGEGDNEAFESEENGGGTASW